MDEMWKIGQLLKRKGETEKVMDGLPFKPKA